MQSRAKRAMTTTQDVTPRHFTVSEYFAWLLETGESARCELVGGEPVGMAPETLRHVRVKQRFWRALDDAVAAAGLPCEALMDGVTVQVDDDTAYEPDVTVACGTPGEDTALIVPDPVIVVEVVSKSSYGRDTGAKLEDYFRVPSIQHYLLVKTDRPVVIHHRRLDTGVIETRFVTEDVLWLDPPGLKLSLDGVHQQ